MLSLLLNIYIYYTYIKNGIIFNFNIFQLPTNLIGW
jgi:hypothetical protein